MSASTVRRNLLDTLASRELGCAQVNYTEDFGVHVPRRVDEIYNKILNGVIALKEAIQSTKWADIEYAVGNIMTRLLENSADPDNLFAITPVKKQEREFFVNIGGVQLLLQLFRKPFADEDARNVHNGFAHFYRRTELWNEVLVVLREVAFAIPTLAEHAFGWEHIVFLFTLLSHQCVFENTMNLLEEILSVRVETFNLALIPNLYNLLDNFSTRQLVHFCRVLSLVLFEPEDRQIMEGSHVLRSLELLQLRRERMAKMSNTVERNQSLIIEMPGLLERLVQVLRIVNYGPTLSQLIRHNIVTQAPITSAIQHFISTQYGAAEWRHFAYLDQLVRQQRHRVQRQREECAVSVASSCDSQASPQAAGPGAAGGPPGGVDGADASSSAGATAVEVIPPTHQSSGASVASAATTVELEFTPPTPQNAYRHQPSIVLRNATANAIANARASMNSGTGDEDEDIIGELLTAFSPNVHPDVSGGLAGGGGRSLDMFNLISVVQLAQRLGITNNAVDDPAAMEAAMEASPLSFLEDLIMGQSGNMPQQAQAQPAMATGPPPRRSEMPQNPPMRFGNGRRTPRSGPITASDAKKELQFHAMLLAPHQVELLFVLCTLLSGRRKIDVQTKFAELGMAEVLHDMYRRMSWDAPPFTGPNPLEHIHGPDCECNPESALRVQYLRLVNNFYDRDFLGNPNRALILSSRERTILKEIRNVEYAPGRLPEGLFIAVEDRGLLTMIIDTLRREPADSIYRLWLSLCLEAYLRGSGSAEQIFVARAGVLAHIVRLIIDEGVRASSNLQTAFDLLGEVVKGNRVTLEMMEVSMGDRDFRQFMDIVMSNLIDSNVLVRSLYLTMETVSEAELRRSEGTSAALRGLELKMRATAAGAVPAPGMIGKAKVTGNVSYLTHSWVQFAPNLLDTACRSGGNATVSDSGDGNRGSSASSRPKGDFDSSAFPHADKPTASVHSRTDGIGMEDGSASVDPPKCTKSPSADGDVDEMYVTPPEFPRYPGVRRGMKITNATPGKTQNSSSAPVSCEDKDNALPDNAACDTGSADDKQAMTPGHRGWKLPDCLFRMSVFLSREREQILLKLMTIVTIRTVNHENICCMNTALLILILSHKRDQLAKVLNQVRLLADEQGAHMLAERAAKENEAEAEAEIELAEAEGDLGRLPPRREEEARQRLDEGSSSAPVYCMECGEGTVMADASAPNLIEEASSYIERLAMGPGADTPASSSTSSARSGRRCVDCLSGNCEYVGAASTKQDKQALRGTRRTNMSAHRTPKRTSAASQHFSDSPIEHSAGMGAGSATQSQSEATSASSSAANMQAAVDEDEDEDGEDMRTFSSRRVMRNFRELLWYWSEYYMRRGRDRLSIEFSSRVPFHVWKQLVDILCRDDGSPTSLIARPLKTPMSPYSRLPRTFTSASPEFVQAVQMQCTP